MADVLNFNAYYWQAPEDFHSSGKISTRSIIENTESLKIHDTQIFGLAQKISDGDLAKSYPYENLLLSETINFIGDLRRNAVAQAKTPWLLSMPENDIVRLLYTGLFKLPPLMYSKLMTSLKTQVRDRQLVCYFGDANTPHGQLLAFLRKMNITGDYMIYSNNEDLSKSLLPLEKMKVLSINITSDVPSVQRCAHANKKVIDIEISTMCDVLITSNNPTGILGATLRTTSTNLFCVNHEGTIYQCVRSELDSSFRDHFHKPLDIMYLKLRT
ncbi:hypothetical protein DPMN_193876 [Dreissena polymorpha]|uniref:Uncharacterized protein n=1 Tax=Dreissena polymorpha TaxID=45954 RepID=A0A9D4BF24_DREPO|nr:hypothetical protein DPMN_193876 [Dreissena polymorpha]